MKIVTLAAVASLALAPSAALARPATDSPTLTHANPSSCLGAERASRNSNGGDRAQGGFGEAQAAYVAALNAGGTMTYGEFLQTYLDSCQYAPGSDDGTDTDD